MKIFAYENFGYEGNLIAVESEIKRGIPSFDIYGINEKAEQDITNPVSNVRNAFKNEGIQFPSEKIEIHLSPKSYIQSENLELAVAMSIVDASDEYLLKKRDERLPEKPCLILGGLGFIGDIKSSEGSYAAVTTAMKYGIKNVICNEQDAEIIKDIPGIKIISANNLENAIYQAKNGMFISIGEEIIATMPFDAKKNAEEKFKKKLKESNKHGNDNKSAFEFVMDYVSDAYNLSDEQKNVVEDSLHCAEEKYYKGGYDSNNHKFKEENIEQLYVDLYEKLSKNSNESEDAFGWMNDFVKRNLTDDLFKKLGTVLNLNTDINVAKINAMLKENDNAVSFNERESIVNSVQDKETFEGLYKVARAVEVVVAGKHNLIIEGKDSKERDSFTENLALYLTPNITPEEQKTVNQIYSTEGLSSREPSVPFRKPTPDIYVEKMIGGGPRLMPGECSLAHNGILFLEKAEQFRVSITSIIRVPLETGNILLSRAGRSTQFPCKFQVISTMRPSPDGNYGSKYDTCTDHKSVIETFRKKIEFSLMNKMEIREFFEKDENDKRIFNPYDARKKNRTAYEIQRKRGIFNRDLKTEDISKYCKLDEKCADFFKNNVSKDEFSQKEATNILKVSLTLANMEGREQIQLQDLNEAYNLSLLAVEKHREISIDKQYLEKQDVEQNKKGISKSIKNAADVQRSMDTINRTSNEKLSLADYEFSR